jgi:hypothetical protein
MPSPRVFISSTHFDLKHVRARLEGFVESLGYEPVLSENGTITYSPDAAPADSCYRDAASADIFVVIIGGRYGSSTKQAARNQRDFYKRYESVTRGEYEAALASNVPIYILVDRDVYSEFETFQKNRESKRIKYAFVDSVNIFYFIEAILAQRGNNPLYKFSEVSEIENWLRKQWAGLLKLYLVDRTSQKKLDALSAQVAELRSLNDSFKTYLQTIVSEVAPKVSKQLIKNEESRIRELDSYRKFVSNSDAVKLSKVTGKSLEELFTIIKNSQSCEDFVNHAFESEARRQVFSALMTPDEELLVTVNELRSGMDLHPLDQAPGHGNP